MDENKCTDLLQTLGTSAAIAPVTMEQIMKGMEDLSAAFRKACAAATEAMRGIAAAALDAVRNLPGGIEWHNAYMWACAVHPKWVTIYHRTKKRRIAKKYRDRILRAYRAEMAKIQGGAGDT